MFFRICLSYAVLVNLTRLPPCSLLYPAAGVIPVLTRLELPFEVSSCPHEYVCNCLCPSPGPLCCETRRHFSLGPVSPHPGNRSVSLVDLQGQVLTWRFLRNTYYAPELDSHFLLQSQSSHVRDEQCSWLRG